MTRKKFKNTSEFKAFRVKLLEAMHHHNGSNSVSKRFVTKPENQVTLANAFKDEWRNKPINEIDDYHHPAVQGQQVNDWETK